MRRRGRQATALSRGVMAVALGTGCLGAHAAVAAAAPGTPLTGEILLNATTARHQVPTHLAVNADGSFIAVWTSLEQRGTNRDVFARVFEPGGAPRSGEILVNSARVGGDQVPTHLAAAADGSFAILWTEQYSTSLLLLARAFTADGVPTSGGARVSVPSIGARRPSHLEMTADGGFVVVWSHEAGSPRYSVCARAYAPGGRARGGEVRVNLAGGSRDEPRQVAVAPDGRFVVVWRSTGEGESDSGNCPEHCDGADGSGEGVFLRLLAADGSPLADPVMVNGWTTGDQVPGQLAMHTDGSFVVTWSSDGQDGDREGVYARRFDTLGTPLGGEFAVSTFGPGRQRPTHLLMDGAGGFVVVWRSRDQDGASEGVYFRRFQADGTPAGDEMRANTYTRGAQLPAHAAMAADGDFAIVWNSAGKDGDGDGVVARAFDADGTPRGGEIAVNGFGTGVQLPADLAMDARGNFAVLWQSEGQDGDGLGTYVRAFRAGGAPAGGDTVVNVRHALDQRPVAIGMDAGGSFVVAFSGYEAGRGGNGAFARVFAGFDDVPDPFGFADRGGVGPGVNVRSAVITPAGFNVPLDVTLEGDDSARVSIDGGEFVRRGTLRPGRSLQLRLRSATAGDTAASTTVTVGGIRVTWEVVTAPQEASR